MLSRKEFSSFFPSTWALLALLSFSVQSIHGSTLELPVGFNRSVRAACESYGSVIKADSPVDGIAFFVPFLSSSTFNSTASPDSVSFSLGFLFINASRRVEASLKTGRPQQLLDDGIYLAICGGMSGNQSHQLSGQPALIFNGVDDTGFNTSLYIIGDGYVVPMWVANRASPLKSLNASLVVVEKRVGSLSNHTQQALQLQDYDGTIVWMVSNTGMMEMQDDGNLVIFDSMNRIIVLWQSYEQPMDTLLQGQKLEVRESERISELISMDGNYSARMEEGALVLFLNNVQLANEQSSPYWIFPIHFRHDKYDFNGNVFWVSTRDDLVSVNSLIASAPCASSNADDKAYGILGNASLKLFLEAGISCSGNLSFDGVQRAFIAAGRDDDFPISWTFLRMENDGRLYINAVIKNSSTALPGTPAIRTYALDHKDAAFAVESRQASLHRSVELQLQAAPFVWDECDVPMACGPFGVCTPHGSPLCSCPSSFFFFQIDPADPSKGCRPWISLPGCGSTGDSEQFSFEFLEMNDTSSILLFTEWNYSSSSSGSTLDSCKTACSSDCSCIGFFYDKYNGKVCFFIHSSKLSFLNSSETLVLMSLADLGRTAFDHPRVNAGLYNTYLKVAELRLSFKNNWTITVPVVLGVLVLCCCCCCCCCCCYRARRRRRREQRCRKIEEEEMQDILPLLPSRFSYKVLEKATNGFGKLLGAGGCGSVYAGVLSDGRKVAVKVLESSIQSGQTKQFLAEVATVGRTNHVNVVRLVGFCWELSHRLLVYEFVERGSLDQWLFTKESSVSLNICSHAPVLDWQTRYNVALGIVRGLRYLHEECAQPVLHFDIKPQNILLDEAFVVKLADFGMSKLMQRDVSRIVTDVRGTPGYIAPEWLAHGAVSKKSDVYSMGMVFLEIIGGRKNVNLALLSSDPLKAGNSEAWHFPSWAAKKCEQGLMMELVDERLHTCGFDAEQVQKLIHVACWCIQDDPSLRPDAPTVLEWLEGDSLVKQPPFNSICTGVHRTDRSINSFASFS